MVNEALNILRRNPSTTVDHHLHHHHHHHHHNLHHNNHSQSSPTLLNDQTDYTDAASSSIITNPSISPPATLVAIKHVPASNCGSGTGTSNSIHLQIDGQQIGNRRGAIDTNQSIGVSPPKRSKLSSHSTASTSTSLSSLSLSSSVPLTSTINAAQPTVTGISKNSFHGSSSASSTSHAVVSGSSGTIPSITTENSYYDINENLRELYGLLYVDDIENEESRVSLYFFPFIKKKLNILVNENNSYQFQI